MCGNYVELENADAPKNVYTLKAGRRYKIGDAPIIECREDWTGELDVEPLVVLTADEKAFLVAQSMLGEA